MANSGDPCSRCGKPEPEVSFYYRNDTGKRRSECKECKQAMNRLWHDAHVDKTKAYQKEYRQENREYFKDYYKEYYLENIEEFRVRSAANYERNKERETIRGKIRYKLNSDHIKAKTLAWQRANPLRKRSYGHRRRQLIKNGDWTPREWEFVKAIFAYACPCCDRKEPEIALEFDHVIPLSKGGDNTIHNCQPLCKSCNSSKGDKTIDFRPMRQ